MSDHANASLPKEAFEHLNRTCFCITLDPQALCRAAQQEVGDPSFCERFLKARPHLFSLAPVFVPRTDMARMLDTVDAIEAAAAVPGYRETVLSAAPAIAQRDFGPRGVFMGYDFHLTDQGPRLIEINTNAGGAFLNRLLARAQRACCAEVERALGHTGAEDFDAAVERMFRREWQRQRGDAPLRRIAIVDDQPEAQYLYPEFLLAQRLLQKAGIDTRVVDAQALRYENGRLLAGEVPIDLVYNRLVDFALEQPAHRALRDAYVDGTVVITPNPHVHAVFADKRNLVALSDRRQLAGWGLAPEHCEALGHVPETIALTEGNAVELWERRKALFFKPASGYGSKAVYRGDKITRSVWSGLPGQGYVAQVFVPPSERMIRIDDRIEARKVDVRLYVYDGALLFSAARLYQGQTTNFRTPGGGFAPVFAL